MCFVYERECVFSQRVCFHSVCVAVCAFVAFYFPVCVCVLLQFLYVFFWFFFFFPGLCVSSFSYTSEYMLFFPFVLSAAPLLSIGYRLCCLYYCTSVFMAVLVWSTLVSWV